MGIEINLLHAHFDPEHLAEVAREMSERGSPVIRVFKMDEGLYFAAEGCHRLRAAEMIGAPVAIEVIDFDGVLDLDTLDWDDDGWFEDRSAAPTLEVFNRMHPQGMAEAHVEVEVISAP